MGTTFIYDHMKKGDFPKGASLAAPLAGQRLKSTSTATEPGRRRRRQTKREPRSDHSGAACSNRSR
ncbi:hypothetical protein [Pseudomonas aeruginosa]|uniref:hypothetical protein n=1 Tax=Pseudomonas aeruginosa TaxID=287 RepID=UPI003D9B95AB